MYDRSGLLTLAAYLTATMAIVVVACLGLFKYGASSPLSGLEPLPADPVPEFAAARLEWQSPEPPDSGMTAWNRQRLDLLQSMLAEKTRRLQELTKLLARQGEEYEDLQKRYDDAMMVAFQSLAQSSSNQASSVESEGTEDLSADGEPARLAAQLAMARAVHEVTLSDLEMLQDELVRAQSELGKSKQDAGLESTNRLREALVLETATAGVLLRVGKAAVPALQESLTHESPLVRRWAATVLGGIGPDAADATVALTEALVDSDPRVRDAAKAALDAIER